MIKFLDNLDMFESNIENQCINFLKNLGFQEMDNENKLLSYAFEKIILHYEENELLEKIIEFECEIFEEKVFKGFCSIDFNKKSEKNIENNFELF